MKQPLAFFLSLVLFNASAFGTMTSSHVHTYTNSSGAGVSIGSPAAGDLMYYTQTGNTWSGLSVASSPSSTWTCFPISTFQGGAAAVQTCYSLSAAGGATTVTPTFTGGGDTGSNMGYVHNDTAGTWGLDSNVSISTGVFLDGSSISIPGPFTHVVTTFTSNGSLNYLLAVYGDETNTQGTHTTIPGGSLSEIQWDNGHVDGTAEWKDMTAQTTRKAGWDIATACTTMGLGLYTWAFTASAGGGGGSAKRRFIMTTGGQ